MAKDFINIAAFNIFSQQLFFSLEPYLACFNFHLCNTFSFSCFLCNKVDLTFWGKHGPQLSSAPYWAPSAAETPSCWFFASSKPPRWGFLYELLLELHYEHASLAHTILRVLNMWKPNHFQLILPTFHERIMSNVLVEELHTSCKSTHHLHTSSLPYYKSFEIHKYHFHSNPSLHWAFSHAQTPKIEAKFHNTFVNLFW